MSARAKRPTYNDFEKILSDIQKQGLSKIIYLYGASSYLKEAARHALESQSRKNGIPTVAMEGTSLQPGKLRELSEQASLFEPAQTYVIKRSDQCKSLPKFLGDIKNPDSMACHFIIVSESDKLLATMNKELTRLKATILPCFEPWPNEMPRLAQKIARKKEVALSQEALYALIDAVGTDLSRLDNELDKLALLELGKKILSADEVRPFLGLIREDHVFTLDQHLADGEWGKAHALCTDLLNRGEKGLQLLWVFSNHCRKALQAHELRDSGLSARDVGFKLRLPPPLAKSYTSLISRTKPQRFRDVLIDCQKADMAFKTSKASEDLVLSQLIEQLAGRMT